jgi:hypothetical protein
MIDGSGNLDAKVGTAEPDAGVGRGGLERQGHFLAGVQADSGTRNLTLEGLLKVHAL